MSIKQLNLESIHDEVLDECFQNENETFENMITPDGDVLEEVEESTFEVLDSKVRLPEGVTNESLITEIRAGVDVKKNTELLVKYNSGLVYGQARSCTCNIPFQDKVQYGFEGLLRAIGRYEVGNGSMFSTYATASIRQTMYNNGNDDVRLVSLPRYLSVENIKMQKYMNTHRSKFGRTPNAQEISTGTGIDIGRVERLIQYSATAPMSIDTPISHGADNAEMSLGDVIKGSSAEFTLNENAVLARASDVIALVMHELPEAEQILLNHVHGLNGYTEKTFVSLENEGLVDAKGKVMKSHSTIHRRYNAVIAKIRTIIAEKNVSSED